MKNRIEYTVILLSIILALITYSCSGHDQEAIVKEDEVGVKLSEKTKTIVTGDSVILRTPFGEAKVYGDSVVVRKMVSKNKDSQDQ